MDFAELAKINVSDKVEKKSGLSYLSWAWAWAEFKKACPDARYKVKGFDGFPYVYDPNTGYMVFTEVTVGEETLSMWLPVMNGANKAMKAEPYTYSTRNGDKTVEAATMFDINKTLMRCLTKNIAMFGLGLYVYAGEDLPEAEPEPPAPLDLKALDNLLGKCETLEAIENFKTTYDDRIMAAPNKDAALDLIEKRQAEIIKETA